jgi:hypothetical protein
LSHRPRSILAQRAEQNGRVSAVGGFPQIGQGRGESDDLSFMAGRYNQRGVI